MKNVIKIICVCLALSSISIFAQDVQEVYEEAKSALLEADTETALLQISIAYAMIEKDPNLDPNGHFKNRLLPKLEQTANNMSSIIKALAEVNLKSQQQLSYENLSPTMEGINAYTELAKNVSNSTMEKRDSILGLYDLDAQYLVAIRMNPVYQHMDQFIAQGIVDSLSQNFRIIANVLTDNLNRLNKNFKKVSADLDKIRKSATASQAEKKKLEQELVQLSKERMNYMNAISEMLLGETSPENPELNKQFLENNVEGIFSEMIRSEIKRIHSLTEVNSSTYKELLKNYELIKNYNRIFLKNQISNDQSDLLAQYEHAINNIKVVEPVNYYPILIGGLVAAVLILLLIYLIRKPKSDTKIKTPPASMSDNSN